MDDASATDNCGEVVITVNVVEETICSYVQEITQSLVRSQLLMTVEMLLQLRRLSLSLILLHQY